MGVCRHPVSCLRDVGCGRYAGRPTVVSKGKRFEERGCHEDVEASGADVRQAEVFTAEIVPAGRAWAAEPVDIDALYDLLGHRPSWQAGAACRGAPPGVNFFPIDAGDGDAARAMCGRCVVVDDCRSWASAQDPDLLKGIWGGLDEGERRRASRRR